MRYDIACFNSSVVTLVLGFGTLCGCTTLAHEHALEAPTRVTLECANALVVGLRWTQSDSRRTAGFEISRDGVSIGRTAQPYFTDLSVTPLAHYSYSVSAVDSWGNAATSTPLEVDTPAASARGDAPYCGGSLLSSISFDLSSAYTQANGSDLWPVTWGQDRRVYAFFGDGGGIGGDNERGRTSFGIAVFTAPPPFTPTTAQNEYGGYQAAHPARIYGKAAAIIAIGNDFYTIGGIYNDADIARHPRKLSNAPDRVQLAYSMGNAHSWQAVSWTFCRPREREPDPSAGEFCASRFVNFGPGYSGARDEYVYVVGVRNEKSYWAEMPMSTPARTYLARVPRSQLLQQRAYRFYAGIDRRGKPLWDRRSTQMQPIFIDRNPHVPGCSGTCSMSSSLGEITYDFGLHRYLGIAQGDYLGQTSFYEAPEPWGPWHVVQYNNIDPQDRSGGWLGLGSKAGGSMGVHIVNAWTSPDGLNLWLTYSSDGVAPQDAAFPPPGTSMDSLNLLPAHLATNRSMQ